MDSWFKQDATGPIQLPISGCKIAFLMIDYALTLVIEHPKGNFELRVSTTFRFTNDLVDTVFDPETRPEQLGPTLRLARTAVQDAIAGADGSLELSFLDQSKLTVPTSEDFEAWELAGPSGFRIVSTPGGELATWT